MGGGRVLARVPADPRGSAWTDPPLAARARSRESAGLAGADAMPPRGGYGSPDPGLGRSCVAHVRLASRRSEPCPDALLVAQFFTFPMAWIAGQSKCMKEVYSTPDESYMAGYTAGT